MRRIVVGLAVFCAAVGISPASAQTFVPWWSPEAVDVAESSGTVVLTLAKGGPGQVRYRTEDGACEHTNPSPSPRTCGAPYARAPRDYGTVSGEVLFTEAGSKQITIPIVHDSQDTSPASDLEVELASGELRPAPELTMDEGPRPAPDRLDGKDRSASSLAFGLGAAVAVFGGGVVWMRQRRRWSQTRA